MTSDGECALDPFLTAIDNLLSRPLAAYCPLGRKGGRARTNQLSPTSDEQTSQLRIDDFGYDMTC